MIRKSASTLAIELKSTSILELRTLFALSRMPLLNPAELVGGMWAALVGASLLGGAGLAQFYET
jgi:hypothetical protein